MSNPNFEDWLQQRNTLKSRIRLAMRDILLDPQDNSTITLTSVCQRGGFEIDNPRIRLSLDGFLRDCLFEEQVRLGLIEM